MEKLIEKRIMAYYDLASPAALSDGSEWYSNAHNFAVELSEQYDTPLLCVCGILSALSPGVQWDSNKKQAENLIKAKYFGTELSDVAISTYKVQRKKAETMIQYPEMSLGSIVISLGEESPKTKAFFWNIYQPESAGHVTIDRWVMRVIGLPNERGRRKLYKTVEGIFYKTSGKLGLLPNQLQAIVWLSIQENIDLPDFVVEG